MQTQRFKTSIGRKEPLSIEIVQFSLAKNKTNNSMKNHAYHRRVIKIIQMTMHQLVTHFITHFMNKQIIIVYMIAVVRINIYEFKFKI